MEWNLRLKSRFHYFFNNSIWVILRNREFIRRFRTILILLFLLFSSASFAQFIDLKPGHPAYPFINKLAREGVLEVGKSKKFEGGGYVNKYQLAVFMDRTYAVLFPGNLPDVVPVLKKYRDLPPQSYAVDAVLRMTALKVFEPDAGGKFNGNLRLNRYYSHYLFVRFIEAVLGHDLTMASEERKYSDIPTNDPYYPYIQKLIATGLLSGGKDRKFNGDNLGTKLELAIFISKMLDYIQPETKSAKGEPVIEASKEAAKGYIDVPNDHYAREAIDELVEIGIIPPGLGQNFYGDQKIDKFDLFDFLSQLMEKLLGGEGEELPLADSALAYKDVESSNPFYRPIQKLIALGVLPPGNRTEIFNGSHSVNRFQLAQSLFTPLENVLFFQLSLEEAPAGSGYRDVPKDFPAYSAIQKMIRLKALPGGEDKDFKGGAPANRFDLAYLSVNLLKKLYLKIKEEEISIAPRPDYGFKALLSSDLSLTSINHGRSTGEDLINASGGQLLNLTISRSLFNNSYAYLYLTSSYFFGSSAARYLAVGEAYFSQKAPFAAYQVGRFYAYAGKSPFGQSIFIDSTNDQVQAQTDILPGKFSCAIGKTMLGGDIHTDSGFVSLLYNLTAFSIDLSLGWNMATNILDPTMTAVLPSKIYQHYAGAKLPVGPFEINLESSNVNYSNLDVTQYIGSLPDINTDASQASLTYYLPNSDNNLSIGYLNLGDDFYNGALSSPGLFTYNSISYDLRGCSALLFKFKFDTALDESLVFNANSVNQNGINTMNAYNLSYLSRVFENAYLNWGITYVTDPTPLQNSSLGASGSYSLSF